MKLPITLNVGGDLSQEDFSRYEEQLSRIAKLAGRTGDAASYSIKQGGPASTASKPDMSALGNQAICYGIYLAAIASGVPEAIARAAYEFCMTV